LNLEISRAEQSDQGTVVDILAEAAGWLAGRGILQWPEHGFPATDVADRIQRGEIYLARLCCHPVATVAIDWSDEYFWGTSDNDAVYVHRLAVRRRWAGNKIGEYLLEWAAEQATAAGKTWVRLDCVAANERLCQYYLDRGWTHVRDVPFGNFTASLFQRLAT
jgi:GNAT superfamily N-acetyltransferase